jgi:hypothetical protein
MQKKYNKGFIGLVVVIVIGLIILGLYGFNLEKILKSDMVSKNLSYAWDLVSMLWQKLIVAPISFVWNKIVIGLIWNNILMLANEFKKTIPTN